MKPELMAFWSGLGTGLGLIIAIGTQNAYVLKQGLLRNHPFIIALICSSIDAVMIVLGVSGLGLIITSNQVLLDIARYGGALFLILYGIMSFKAVFKNEFIAIDRIKSKSTLKNTVLTLLALSLLNPHLYLDTCVLIGTIGAQFKGIEKKYFTIGAVTSSFIWFFALSYGAKLLVPLFQKPLSWKILDFIVGVVMWSIAGFLILGM
jgi:L-lysine exporter family protein LysE/ArgO